MTLDCSQGMSIEDLIQNLKRGKDIGCTKVFAKSQVQLHFSRLETDEEFNDRKERELRYLQARKERELRELKRLKEKYPQHT